MAKQQAYNGRRNDATRTDDIQTRALSLRAETINEDARTVQATLSTENPVVVMDYRRWEPIEEVLLTDAGEFRDQVVMLEAHSRYDLSTLIGSVRSITKTKTGLSGTLHFASDDERSDRAWKLAKQGHLTDVSVGYRVMAYQDIDPGQTVTVNGRTFKAGQTRMRIVTRWKLREVSVVPIGADEQATLRSQHGPDQAFVEKGETNMNKHLREYLESLGLRADATEAEAWAKFDGLAGAERSRAEMIRNGSLVPNADSGTRSEQPSTTQPVVSTLELRNAPDVAETARAAAVAAIAERDRLDAERVASIRAEAEEYGIPSDVAQRAIDGRMSVDAARKEFLTHLRKSRSEGVGAGFGIVNREFDSAEYQRALSAGMQLQFGLKPVDETAPKGERDAQEKAADVGYRFRSYGLTDYIMEACRSVGVRVGTRSELMDALRSDLIGTRAATAAISNVLGATVNKSMLATYTEVEDTTMGWCREVDVPDYKLNTVVRMTGSTGLQKVGENAQAKDVSFNDSAETYKVARYGAKFGVDEITIRNDDLSAIQSVPQAMGVAAARLRPGLVYYILLNGVAGTTLSDGYYLFDATNHRNYLAGASGALSATTIQAGIATMGKQYETLADGTKRSLNLSPAHLVVPKDLYFAASIALNSAERVIASTSGGTFNPLRGLLNLHSDDRIGVNGVTDPDTGTSIAGTATGWFLVANPIDAEVIRVAYLQGTGRRPSTRSYIESKGRWGIGWDIEHTIGAAAVGFEGVYYANGHD